mgnify:CR=1 FL=1
MNTIKNSLISLKDPIPTLEMSGVHSLKCGDCPSYVGETSRQFEKRVKEHVSSRNPPWLISSDKYSFFYLSFQLYSSRLA